MAKLIQGALIAGHSDTNTGSLTENTATQNAYNAYVSNCGGLAPGVLHQGFNIKASDGSTVAFPTNWCNRMRNLGAIPMITMQPRQSGAASGTTQADWSYDAICAGNHDAHFINWANAMNALGYGIILRFAHEFNGSTWFPWLQGQSYNLASNGATKTYADMWRYVHSLMAPLCPKVAWYWCANTKWLSYPLNSSNWPGAAYVDFAGFDTYYGEQVYGSPANQSLIGTWQDTYNEVASVCQGKPMIVGETGAEESILAGGSLYKKQWLTQLWAQNWASTFPLVKIVVYYHRDHHTNHSAGNIYIENWLYTTSADSLAGAQTLGTQTSKWAGNEFGSLTTKPAPLTDPVVTPPPADPTTIKVSPSGKIRVKLHRKV